MLKNNEKQREMKALEQACFRAFIMQGRGPFDPFLLTFVQDSQKAHMKNVHSDKNEYTVPYGIVSINMDCI